MLIDWFTVGAQVLNFLILVWLLKHFLYKPILNAIDAREKRIAAELADADAKKTEAKRSVTNFEDKNKAFDEQRSALLEQGHGRGESRARAPSQRSATKMRIACAPRKRTHCEMTKARLGSEITRLAEQEVFAIARKALTDLATVSLEERVGEVFTRRLREMDGKAKESAGRGAQDVIRTGRRAQRLRYACRPAGCNSKCAQRNLLGGNPHPVRRLRRTRSAASN